MNVVILAGGKGARMGDATRKIPKPMLHMAGKPILEYQVELARKYFFNNIYILTGYKRKVIEDYFKDGSKWGVRIKYSDESIPLGTAGAIKNIEDRLDEDFFVFYGDVMMDVDLDSMLLYHMKKGPVATIVVHPNDHPYDSDLVEVNKNNEVIAFHRFDNSKNQYYQNLVNAALYILSPTVLKYIKVGEYQDLG